MTAFDALISNYVNAKSGGPATTTTQGIVQLANDLGGTADAPTVPGLVGKVSKSTQTLNAKDYGAKGDGTTDDTAALQSLVTACTMGALSGFIPAGNYLITAPLNFSCRPGWSIIGAGRETTTITQATNNVAILNLGSDTASSMHSWRIMDMGLTYTNTQPPANTLANPILFSQMGYLGQLRNVNFKRGFYAIRVANGINAPWGTSWDDLIFSGTLSGGAMDWSQSINGIPNNHFGRMTCGMDNMTQVAFKISGYNFRIDTIEFLNNYNGVGLMDFAAGSVVSIGTVKLEVYTFNQTAVLLNFQTNCFAQIDHIVLDGSTPSAFNVPAGSYLYIIGGGGGGNGRVECKLLHAFAASSNTGGGVAALASSTTGSPIVFGHVQYNAPWTLTWYGSTSSAETVTVRSFVNERAVNLGDADYTAQLGTPNILSFTTAFTAPRTITLGPANTDLFNGMWYMLVFNGAINGTNTATIKVGATTLATMGTNKTWIKFVFSRASGWTQVQSGTLV